MVAAQKRLLFLAGSCLAGALIVLTVIASMKRTAASQLQMVKLKFTDKPGHSFMDFLDECQSVKSKPWYDNIQDPAKLADNCSGDKLSYRYMAYMRKHYPDYYHVTPQQAYQDHANGYV
uniref:Uncharacterized protein n=1 Tax=Cryptomonas paramaecium TaxID=2898 RepID=A0A7S4PR50_9CRYP|mmetsp:Transcript_10551/g.29840  ORF Transcript_10551/g.29840 Transcript_10551/m.29840 type:complete len:119 (+) Transcript_10551:38-394(+)